MHCMRYRDVRSEKRSEKKKKKTLKTHVLHTVQKKDEVYESR